MDVQWLLGVLAQRLLVRGAAKNFDEATEHAEARAAVGEPRTGPAVLRRLGHDLLDKPLERVRTGARRLPEIALEPARVVRR
jgi:hypothetical protein